MWKKTCLAIASTAMLYACAYDQAVTPESTNTCDPDIVYFERDIQPLLVSNCAQSGCHNEQSREEGVIYTNYVYTMRKGGVKPGNPEDSELYEIITEADDDDRMPPSPRPRLSEAQIALIYKWIAQGAKNLTCDDNNTCVTENVSFAATISPIIQNKCQGCHNSTRSDGGVQLVGHTQIAKQALEGKMLCAISHEAGCSPMPSGSPKLPDCEIQQITAWINAGAPNN